MLKAPLAVGNGNDYSAVVSGTISQATGSFNHVSGGISEKGQVDGQGAQKPNEFTLQLNSQFFSSPACSGSSDPSSCLGWEQFVYDTSSNSVFMQYWLIYYDATCPHGWFTYSYESYSGNAIFCYANSPASAFSGGPLTAGELAGVKFVGRAASGGNDEVAMSVGTGTATMVVNSDDMVDLAQYWNTAEFNVFGDADGGQANFGANTTLDPQTTLVASGSPTEAPTCVAEGFTAETNNLKLSGAPALGAEPGPTIESAQTNGAVTTASCAAIGASSTPAITNPGPQPARGQPAEVASTTITPLTIDAVSYTGATLAYSAAGLPPGLAIDPSSGVISGIPTKAGTYSVTATASAGNYSASTAFSWKITVCGRGCAVVSLTNPGAQSSIRGTPTSLQIQASDSGYNKLGYSATGLPTGLRINSSTGLISGTPTKLGSYNVTVRVTDSAAGTSQSAPFSWVVTS